MIVPSLAPQCVFTIKNLDELAEIYRNGGAGEVTENKPWVSAKGILEDAKRNGESLVVFFSDAASVGNLHYWAIVTAISITGRKTKYHFEKLSRFVKKPRQDALEVTSTDQKLSMDHIRPYVLCSSPSPKSALHSHMQSAKRAPSRTTLRSTVSSNGGRSRELKGLTIFSFGYKGWGNVTSELVQAIDAVEKSRGFEPPIFVDVRIRRSVRAEGFRDHAFENLLGESRYRWMKGLGNRYIETREGPPIQIADPSTAKDLLELAIEAARGGRRIIFFCGCQWPKESGKITCHRTTVGQLLLKSARQKATAAEIVEWPGGEPSHIALTVKQPLFDSMCRNLKYVPLPQRVPSVDYLGLPWGSTATLVCGDQHLHCRVGRAVWQADHWSLPILDRQEPNGDLADYESGSASVARSYGLTSKTTEQM